ncbi:MAG: glycosyltransferase [Gemmataceae bacterium]|nr:glycosyltransferase [Gemmataceae bacterium]
MKVLFVISDLEYRGAAKQLGLLARGLPRDRFEPHVCVLGAETPRTKELRTAGVPVEALGWRHALNLGAAWRLRGLLRNLHAEVVHVWGQRPLMAVALLCGGRGRMLATLPNAVHKRGIGAELVHAMLLRRVERIVSTPPAVAEMPNSGAAPAGMRFIACVGPLERHKGFRDAIWTFDILRYVEEDVHLVIAGDGPDRPRLEQFVRDTRTSDRVHIIGGQEQIGPLLARAEVVWVPSRTTGGVNVALEAMMLGRPVIAARTPELAELVVDGRTGLFFPPGDKVTLARLTRGLLTDAALCQRLGEAGRERALAAFSVSALVERMAGLYEGRAG